MLYINTYQVCINAGPYGNAFPAQNARVCWEKLGLLITIDYPGGFLRLLLDEYRSKVVDFRVLDNAGGWPNFFHRFFIFCFFMLKKKIIFSGKWITKSFHCHLKCQVMLERNPLTNQLNDEVSWACVRIQTNWIYAPPKQVLNVGSWDRESRDASWSKKQSLNLRTQKRMMIMIPKEKHN